MHSNGSAEFVLPKMSFSSKKMKKQEPAGNFVSCSKLIRKFISATDDLPLVFDTPKPKISLTKETTRKTIILYALSCLFGLIFAVDLADIFSGGEYEQTPFGQRNPWVSRLGFCSSQVSLFITCIGLTFLIKHSTQIIQCARILDTLSMTFMPYLPKYSLLQNKLYTQRYIMALIFLGCGRFACALCSPSILHKFWTNSTYVWIALPKGAVVLYNESCMLISLAVSVPVTASFTYLSGIFIQCLEAFNAENNDLCIKVHKPESRVNNAEKVMGTAMQNSGITVDLFSSKLKTLRIHHEDLNDTYDKLQEIFGFKMIIDMVTNLFALLAVIAWFTMTSSANQWMAPAVTWIWHSVSILIYLGTIWMVANRPLLLQRKHTQMVDMIEQLLFQRQLSTTSKPSREEIIVTYALRQRLRSKVLSFSAGGVLDIRHMAISFVAAVGGFIAFMCERVSNMEGKLQDHDKFAAEVVANATCNK
ncbi:uncharacterized protein LOC129602582 [Paramacrobiotus metropolitanus]|uniref:uncharacterized protein LOC129602582 n=1 Tax=Paramacrobiotus metropolitanus TaxID=2943436 RepID=UPI002445E471|nr:uncharacterized protein LOC129602582 [Paramacrobiotus metropolitanus]